MATLLNKKTGRTVSLPFSKIEQALYSEEFQFSDDEDVPGYDPGGKSIYIKGRDVLDGLNRGYRLASPEEVKQDEINKKYGEDEGLAGLAGAARGATLGLSDLALTKTGLVQPETLKGLREANPLASTGSEIASGIASAFLPGALAAKGLGAVAKAASILPTNLVAKGGAQLAEIGSSLLGGGSLAKVAGATLGGAAEGAIYGAGQWLTEESLGDTDFNAERLIASMGNGELIGGILGGGTVGFIELLKKPIKWLVNKQTATEAITSEDLNLAQSAIAKIQSNNPEDKAFFDLSKKLSNIEWNTNLNLENLDLNEKQAFASLLKKTETLKETASSKISKLGEKQEKAQEIISAKIKDIEGQERTSIAAIDKKIEGLQSESVLKTVALSKQEELALDKFSKQLAEINSKKSNVKSKIGDIYEKFIKGITDITGSNPEELPEFLKHGPHSEKIRAASQFTESERNNLMVKAVKEIQEMMKTNDEIIRQITGNVKKEQVASILKTVKTAPVKNEAFRIINNIEKKLSELRLDPDIYETKSSIALFEKGVERLKTELKKTKTASDVFYTMEGVRTTYFRDAMLYGSAIDPITARTLKELAPLERMVRDHLEDPEIYGAAGILQQKINSIVTAYLRKNRRFEDAFGRVDKSGPYHRVEIDPDKMRSWFKKQGAPLMSSLKREGAIKDVLDATNQLKQLAKTIDEEIKTGAPLSAFNESIEQSVIDNLLSSKSWKQAQKAHEDLTDEVFRIQKRSQEVPENFLLRKQLIEESIQQKMASLSEMKDAITERAVSNLDKLAAKSQIDDIRMQIRDTESKLANDVKELESVKNTISSKMGQKKGIIEKKAARKRELSNEQYQETLESIQFKKGQRDALEQAMSSVLDKSTISKLQKVDKISNNILELAQLYNASDRLRDAVTTGKYGSLAIGAVKIIERTHNVFNKFRKSITNKAGEFIEKSNKSEVRPPSGLIRSGVLLQKKPEKEQREDFNQIQAQLDQYQVDPELLSEVLGARLGEEHQGMPGTAMAANQLVAKALMFLESKLPKNPLNLYQTEINKDQNRNIPFSQINKFLAYADAINNPLLVLDEMERGVPKQETLEVLKTIYPKIYNQIQEEFMSLLSEKGLKLNYEQKLKFTRAFGINYLASESPVMSKFTQQFYAVNQQKQPSPQRNPIRGLNDQMQTSIERVQT